MTINIPDATIIREHADPKWVEDLARRLLAHKKDEIRVSGLTAGLLSRALFSYAALLREEQHILESTVPLPGHLPSVQAIGICEGVMIAAWESADEAWPGSNVTLRKGARIIRPSPEFPSARVRARQNQAPR